MTTNQITLENIVCIECGTIEKSITFNNNYKKSESALRAGHRCTPCDKQIKDRRRNRRR